MKQAVIGLDTSNYRTSVAAVTTDGEILFSNRELLPVAEGERGLRQSDAVFAHLKRFGSINGHLFPEGAESKIVAVAASVTPRDGEASYMPVFQVGTSFGRMLAAILEVPFLQPHTSAGIWLQQRPGRGWKVFPQWLRCICPAGQPTCWKCATTG